jgi:hypothetical protein
MTFYKKNYVNLPSKSKKQKELRKKSFFVGVLKVKDENNRIRIRIRTQMSWIHNTDVHTVSDTYAGTEKLEGAYRTGQS